MDNVILLILLIAGLVAIGYIIGTNAERYDRKWRYYRMTHIHWISADRPPEDGDEEFKLVTCQTKSGKLSWNRAWYDGSSWHGQGSMAGVIAWAEIEPYQDMGAETNVPASALWRKFEGYIDEETGQSMLRNAPGDGDQILIYVKTPGHEKVQMDEFGDDDGYCFLRSGYNIYDDVDYWLRVDDLTDGLEDMLDED